MRETFVYTQVPGLGRHSLTLLHVQGQLEEVREVPPVHNEHVKWIVKAEVQPAANPAGAAARTQVPQGPRSLRNKHTRHLKTGVRNHDNSRPKPLPQIKYNHLPFTDHSPHQGFFLFPLKCCLTWPSPAETRQEATQESLCLKQHILRCYTGELPFLPASLLPYFRCSKTEINTISNN